MADQPNNNTVTHTLIVLEESLTDQDGRPIPRSSPLFDPEMRKDSQVPEEETFRVISGEEEFTHHDGAEWRKPQNIADENSMPSVRPKVNWDGRPITKSTPLLDPDMRNDPQVPEEEIFRVISDEEEFTYHNEAVWRKPQNNADENSMPSVRPKVNWDGHPIPKSTPLLDPDMRKDPQVPEEETIRIISDEEEFTYHDDAVWRKPQNIADENSMPSVRPKVNWDGRPILKSTPLLNPETRNEPQYPEEETFRIISEEEEFAYHNEAVRRKPKNITENSMPSLRPKANQTHFQSETHCYNLCKKQFYETEDRLESSTAQDPPSNLSLYEFPQDSVGKVIEGFNSLEESAFQQMKSKSKQRLALSQSKSALEDSKTVPKTDNV